MTAWNGQQREWLADSDHDDDGDDGDDADVDTERIPIHKLCMTGMQNADTRDSKPTEQEKWKNGKWKGKSGKMVERLAVAISRFLPPCGSITFLNRYVRRHVKGGKHRRV